MQLVFLFILSLIPFQNTSKPNLDEMVVYKLPTLANYLTRVDCEDIKTRLTMKSQTIIEGKKIKAFYELVMDKRHFKLDTSSVELDIRLSIELKRKNQVIHTYCYSPTGKILIDNKVYTFDKEFENYLFENKFIDFMRQDSI